MDEQIEDKYRCILIPKESIAVFHLGDLIEKYKVYNHTYISKDKSIKYDMDSYKFIDFPVTIWTDYKTDLKIETIKCDVSCVWKNNELIGMPYDYFLDIYKLRADKHEQIYTVGPSINGRNYDVYDFDELDLMVWVWRGKIREILVSKYEEDEAL